MDPEDGRMALIGSALAPRPQCPGSSAFLLFPFYFVLKSHLPRGRNLGTDSVDSRSAGEAGRGSRRCPGTTCVLVGGGIEPWFGLLLDGWPWVPFSTALGLNFLLFRS